MKTKQRRQNQLYFAIAGSFLIIIILVLGNYQMFKTLNGGGEFAAQWKGIQLLINSGENPYSSRSETLISSVSSQFGFPPVESSYNFNSALFSLVLYTPFALVKDVKLAMAFWAAFSEILLGLTLYLFIRFIKDKAIFLISFLMIIFTFFSLPSFYAITTGSSAIVVVFLLFFGAICTANGKDELAGILFAVSMIRTDLVLMTIIFLMAWSIRCRRWTFGLWFLGALVLLSGFAMLFVPGWIVNYLLGLTSEVFSQFEFNSVISNRLYIFMAILLVILLIIEWLVNQSISSKRVVWLVAITVTVSILVNRQERLNDLVLLYPATLFGLFLLRDRWGNRVNSVVYFILTGFFVLTWMSSPILFPYISPSITSWVLHGFYPLLVLVLLYWSRWWVIQDARLPDAFNTLRVR